MRTIAAAVSIAFFVCAIPLSRASAQSITRAERQYLQADFEAARVGFRAVLASPTVDRAQAANAHRYLAAIELAFGNAPSARAHLEAALVLSRDVTLPSGAEELEPVLAELRASMGTRSALRITSRGPMIAGRPARVVARLEPAPAPLGTRIALRCGPSAMRDAPLPEVSVSVTPTLGDVSCTADVETSAGAAILSTRRTFRVGSRTGGATSSPAGASDDRGRALPAWPFFVGGAALVTIGAIVVIAVVASSGSDEAFVGRPEVDGW